MFTDYLLLLTVCTNNYNAILCLRIDFGLVSSCFMQKLNSGLIGNLAQVQVFTLSCHKSGNGQEKKVLQGQGKVRKFCFKSEKMYIFQRI